MSRVNRVIYALAISFLAFGPLTAAAAPTPSPGLDKVLVDIANSLEKRTTRQLELFVRLLEPEMLLVMAAVTLVVVMGLLLPVFKMSSAL